MGWVAQDSGQLAVELPWNDWVEQRVLLWNEGEAPLKVSQVVADGAFVTATAHGANANANANANGRPALGASSSAPRSHARALSNLVVQVCDAWPVTLWRCVAEGVRAPGRC
jgi:hypothetical protein